MKKWIFIILVQFIFIQVYSQYKTAYTIFNEKGKKISYEKMLQAMDEADIILFGELHNNPISHWLQYELSSDLIKTKKIIFGSEMFEADTQNELNKYLKGEIDQKRLDSLARLWPNYKRDYAPIVDLAKEKQLSFIATNIPRKYANMVYKSGFEVLNGLTNEEKTWMATLPIEYNPNLPGYKKMLSMNLMKGTHDSENLPKAQAIKDATMAYFISKNYINGNTFIHFHGTYHTDNYEGILWYLKRLRPTLKYITISSVVQSDPSKILLENKGKADFIICIDENVPSTL